MATTFCLCHSSSLALAWFVSYIWGDKYENLCNESLAQYELMFLVVYFWKFGFKKMPEFLLKKLHHKVKFTGFNLLPNLSKL